ncbi:UpxY family transcription antiterminator [bacterium]|nr:UpxY family transcription antiterminator [bacterium]
MKPNITADTSDTDSRDWFALYTRPRFEKKINLQLEQKGVESLLPMRSVIRLWSDRKKKILEPLFPSYVFIRGDNKERYLALQTQGVIRIVSFEGRPARIPEHQIQSIGQLLELGYAPEPYHFLDYGDEVEIATGPLKGLHGYFVEERSHDRLVISIRAIRQSIALEVDRGQIRRIGPSVELTKPVGRNKYGSRLVPV